MIKRIRVQEDVRMEILSHMTEDTHKFAIPVGHALEQDVQDELEWLMLNDWIRLIDVSPIAAYHGLVRVFRVMPGAVTWYWEQFTPAPAAPPPPGP